jgi:hypothetical protein
VAAPSMAGGGQGSRRRRSPGKEGVARGIRRGEENDRREVEVAAAVGEWEG